MERRLAAVTAGLGTTTTTVTTSSKGGTIATTTTTTTTQPAAGASPPVPPVAVTQLDVGAPAAVGGSVASAEDVGADSAGLEALADALKQRVGDGELPCLGLMVARRGKVVFSGCAGEAVAGSGRALAPDTICRMYSMTKALVSTGALLLIEQGKLSLDGKVSDYLPYWDDAKVTIAPAVEGAGGPPVAAERAITIRMLCCHASGIGSPTPVGWNPYTGEAPTAKNLKEFVTVVLETPLMHQPGAIFDYQMSTDFLGAVIEEVSGQRLGAFLKENLFDLLGMPDTGFEIPAAKLDRFSEMYMGKSLGEYKLAASPLCLSDKGTNWLEGEVFGHGGGGGILSTANDYMRFTQWLATGCTSLDGEAKALISPALVEEMRVRIQARPTARFPGRFLISGCLTTGGSAGGCRRCTRPVLRPVPGLLRHRRRGGLARHTRGLLPRRQRVWRRLSWLGRHRRNQLHRRPGERALPCPLHAGLRLLPMCAGPAQELPAGGLLLLSRFKGEGGR